MAPLRRGERALRCPLMGLGPEVADVASNRRDCAVADRSEVAIELVVFVLNDSRLVGPNFTSLEDKTCVRRNPKTRKTAVQKYQLLYRRRSARLALR